MVVLLFLSFPCKKRLLIFEFPFLLEWGKLQYVFCHVSKLQSAAHHWNEKRLLGLASLQSMDLWVDLKVTYQEGFAERVWLSFGSEDFQKKCKSTSCLPLLTQGQAHDKINHLLFQTFIPNQNKPVLMLLWTWLLPLSLMCSSWHHQAFTFLGWVPQASTSGILPQFMTLFYMAMPTAETAALVLSAN